MDDWRLRGQDTYLKHIKLLKLNYSKRKTKTDHDHCEFCWKKFTDENDLHGYTTEDHYRWICEECYNDFKELFQWQVNE